MIRLLIKTKFNIIGAAAAAANLLLVFRIPEKKDDKLTKNKNNHKRALESKNKNNFKIKKNKDRKRLDPNNPFAALASLIKDNKDKFN